MPDKNKKDRIKRGKVLQKQKQEQKVVINIGKEILKGKPKRRRANKRKNKSEVVSVSPAIIPPIVQNILPPSDNVRAFEQTPVSTTGTLGPFGIIRPTRITEQPTTKEQISTINDTFGISPEYYTKEELKRIPPIENDRVEFPDYIISPTKQRLRDSVDKLGQQQQKLMEYVENHRMNKNDFDANIPSDFQLKEDSIFGFDEVYKNPLPQEEINPSKDLKQWAKDIVDPYLPAIRNKEPPFDFLRKEPKPTMIPTPKSSPKRSRRKKTEMKEARTMAVEDIKASELSERLKMRREEALSKMMN